MSRLGFYSIAMISFASTIFSQQCPVQFDARVPFDTKPADFDIETSLFDTQNVIGEGLRFGQVIELPPVSPSIFDNGTIPVEVTISDQSIFNGQTTFRRCELLPKSVTGDDPSTEGIKTIHFSVQIDPAKKLNTSHEYQLAFMENADFTTNQWALKTGTILGHEDQGFDNLVLFGNINDGQILFKTPFIEEELHNFALTMNFEQNEIAVYYSQGAKALQNVLPRTINDLSGRGQFHFGPLKKPVGSKGDLKKDGFQPSNIHEGIIYAGIFQEDSIDGCISTSA